VLEDKIVQQATAEVLSAVYETDFKGFSYGFRAGLAKRCEELGFDLDSDEIASLYEKFSELADRKKEIFDDDLRILIMSMRDETFDVYHLEMVQTSGNDPAMALVKIRKGDEDLVDTATGDGPVHAACMAIERIIGIEGKLEEFSVRAATPGQDAVGEAHLTVLFGGLVLFGLT